MAELVEKTYNDEDLKLLESHISAAESLTIEFKEKIPDNVVGLAKNIASFVTSNQGTIYIGISDFANIVRVNEDIDRSEERDKFQRRILGIVSKYIL
jgi:predicted HTH transcriptional regulator